MFLRMTRALLLGISWFAVMETGNHLLADEQSPKPPEPGAFHPFADKEPPKPPEPGVLFAGSDLPLPPEPGAFHPFADKEPPKPPEPGVLFAGSDLPLPPKQGQPWTPPASKLPEKWITACQELFHRGFADPRGCEYREVKFTYSSSIWGGSFLTKTHAWVLPKSPGEKADAQRFAVTWDGMVYPVVEVGPPANLRTDVETLIKKSVAGENDMCLKPLGVSAIPVKGHPEFWSHQMQVVPEASLVAHDYLFAIKTCLLLRLGEADLAERLWSTWKRPNLDILTKGSSDDPYMVFVWEWGWALFDCAVGAHLRGDDVIAIRTAKTLVEFEESVPRIAAQRGFQKYRSPGSDRLIAYLPLLDPPARLLEDAARRVKAGTIRRALDVGLDKFPDQSQRIAALVRDLEVVNAGPGYARGGVPLSPSRIEYMPSGIEEGPPVDPLRASPIVQALVKEGAAAIDPLLDCLIHDRRLTRVVGMGYHDISGDLLPARDFIAVDVAAYAALCGIMKADGFGPLTEEGYYHDCSDEPTLENRRAAAAEIRRRWERIKGRREEETWLAVLADPQMTCKLWLDAAEKIVAPVGQPSFDQRAFLSQTEPLSSKMPSVPWWARCSAG